MLKFRLNITDSAAGHFKYVGGRLRQTIYPDYIYTDGGVIRYLDGADTGWVQEPPVKTYRDYSVIRVGS